MKVREENGIIREELAKLDYKFMHYWNDKSKHSRRKVFKPGFSLYSRIKLQNLGHMDVVDRNDMDTVLEALDSRGVYGWERCYSAFNKKNCIGIKKHEEL